MTTIRQLSEARFFISNIEKYDGDLSGIIYKIVEKRARNQARWIDNNVKKLLPNYIVKVAPKLGKYRVFRSLIRIIFDIDIAIIRSDVLGTRTVCIGQRGKELFSKTFK